MGVRFMLDSDNLADLSPVAELLATYSDLVTDLPALRAKFPDSVVLLIDRGQGDPTGQASIWDVEPGCLTIAEAVAKYDDAVSRGIKYPTIYDSRGIMPEVVAAMGHRHFWKWIATLDGTAHIADLRPLHDPAAVQCLSAAELGIHADGSLVFRDDWNPTLHAMTQRGVAADVRSIGAAADAVGARLSSLAESLRG